MDDVDTFVYTDSRLSNPCTAEKMGPTSIDHSVISQKSSNTIPSILTNTSGDNILSLTTVIGEGISFVAYTGLDGITNFGQLVFGDGSRCGDAVRHEGKIYQDVKFGRYVQAKLLEELGNKLSDEQITLAKQTADGEYYGTAIVAGAHLWQVPRVFARWQSLRERHHGIKTRIQGSDRLEDDTKKVLQAIFDSTSIVSFVYCERSIVYSCSVAGYFEWNAADHLKEVVSIAAEEAYCVIFSGTISSELASAACGRVGPSGRCRLSPGQADLLKEHCHLGVGNPELFLIA